MGANEFTTTGTGPTVNQAFGAAVDRALYDYGHAGYTGTIAEKGSFIEFRVPAGITPDDMALALAVHWYRDDTEDAVWPGKERLATYRKVVEAMGEREFERMHQCYDDKWGPAVAIRKGENEWIFTGYASS